MQNLKNSIFASLKNIESSFLKSIKGEEELRVVIRWWGLIAYLFFYFIVQKIVLASHSYIFQTILSSVAIIYFSWHIFALKKCEPKKPKLTKEEKIRLRKEKIHNIPRSFMRKLLLQEPISKWNTVNVLIALDLLFILIFLDYIMR